MTASIHADTDGRVLKQALIAGIGRVLAERDLLNEFNVEFYTLNDADENLIELNSRWLKAHPQLQALDQDALEAQFDAIAAKIPNLEEREAENLENQPRYVLAIGALCEATGQELDRITAGDPTHEYEGQPSLAWHFLTDAGHFYMLDMGDKALMFHGDTHQLVAEADISYLAEDDEDEG